MEGLTLFCFLSENDATKKDAYLVGKNIFNQNPSNEDIFLKYFDYLCNFASYPIIIDERKFYANEADIALAFFTENVRISEATLQLIKECKSKLEKIIKEIISLENVISQKAFEEIQQKNGNELCNLVELKGKLFTASKKAEFDSLLLLVKKSESALEKDYLSPDQKELYDTLTSEYSKVVADKLAELLELYSCEEADLSDFGYYPHGKKGEFVTYESSSDLRDTESVPLKQSIYQYFLDEVKPHVAEAWLNMESVKIGCEISFNKYFYRHKPLRKLEAVAQEIIDLEKQADGLIAQILGLTTRSATV